MEDVSPQPRGGIFAFKLFHHVYFYKKTILMKNIDKLAKYIKENGKNGILVHSIYGTNQWIVAQRMEKDQWTLMLMKPMESVTYNLGTLSHKQHLDLWEELMEREVKERVTILQRSKELNKIVSGSMN